MAAGHIVNGVQVWEYPTERVVCKNEIKGNGMQLRDEQFAVVVKLDDDQDAVWFDVFWVGYATENGLPRKAMAGGQYVPTLEKAQAYVEAMHGERNVVWKLNSTLDVWSAFEIEEI